MTAYVLETLSYAITLAYSVKSNFPFSTYGENLFLTIQDILITLLIIVFAPTTSSRPRDLSLASLAIAGTTYLLWSLPLSTLAPVQFSTLLLSLFSKVPQIVQNTRAGSTGQLSTVAVFAQILGCVARLFTTATEVRDTLVLSGFALALVLNLVLGSQMWMYWDHEVKAQPTRKVTKVEESEEIASPQVKAEKAMENGKSSAYEALGDSPQPMHRLTTPPPRNFSAGSQRKWARKIVD